MCDTCGCGTDHHHFTIQNPDGQNEPVHSHDHQHDSKTVIIETDILSNNKLLAERNRGYFEAKSIKAFNMVSSPGSGKTTLLEKLINVLIPTKKIYVIEGDQQTSIDALRIRNAGAIATQINTGKGCHLDAHMINHAIKDLNPAEHSFLFIENVGNLICPALFDLGEKQRITVISITEGEDKPLKYPDIFQGSQLCILNKIDLLPFLDYDLEKFKTNLLQVNPEINLLLLSAMSGEGLNLLSEYLQNI
jgi:hydrogenase nickel incorporation protein HypB